MSTGGTISVDGGKRCAPRRWTSRATCPGRLLGRLAAGTPRRPRRDRGRRPEPDPHWRCSTSCAAPAPRSAQPSRAEVDAEPVGTLARRARRRCAASASPRPRCPASSTRSRRSRRWPRCCPRADADGARRRRAARQGERPHHALAAACGRSAPSVEEFEDGFRIEARPLVGGTVDAPAITGWRWPSRLPATRRLRRHDDRGAVAVDVSYPGFFDALERPDASR